MHQPHVEILTKNPCLVLLTGHVAEDGVARAVVEGDARLFRHLREAGGHLPWPVGAGLLQELGVVVAAAVEVPAV